MDNIIIQGFDLLDVSRLIIKTNKKYQRKLLSEIEKMNLSMEEYSIIRKLILDSTNDFCRDIMDFLFGDIYRE